MSMPCPCLASGKEDHDKMETMSMCIKKLISNNMHDDMQACVLFVPCFVVFRFMSMSCLYKSSQNWWLSLCPF